MPSPSILLLSAAFRPHPGGVSTHTTDLAHGLARAGHPVNVMTLRTSGDFKAEPRTRSNPGVWKWPNRQVSAYDGRRVFLEDIVSFLLDELTNCKPRVVHAHDFDSLYLGWMLKMAWQVPLVFTYHNAPRQWRPELHAERPKTCFLELVRSARTIDHIIVPSRASSPTLHEQGFPRQRVRVIPHGIRRYLASVRSDGKLLESLQLNRGDILILCPTRIDVHKDVETFIDAACLLKARFIGQRLRFLVTSRDEGTEHDLLVQYAQGRGITIGDELVIKQFSYHEMASIYRRADVCVICSPRESFGLTALEAFLLRTPVIAANQGALPEVIIHRETGLLFEFGDPGDLATHVTHLLKDAGLRDSLVENANREVKPTGKFAAERMIAEVAGLYRDILEKGRAALRDPRLPILRRAH